jgi:O-antigen/teichoic acid export membrane protein
MVAVYGISPVLTGIAAIPLGLLIRKMRAHVLFARTVISKGTSVAVGILLASLGFGAWSIILGLLGGSVAAGIGLWLARRYVPTLRFDVGEFRRIARFGGLFSLDAFISSAALRLGLFLVGAINGSTVLGFFAFALRIVDEIASLIGSLANRLGLAYFATVGATSPQIAQSFLRGSHLIAAISFPIYAGLAAVAPDAVPLIFGPAWTPAIPIVQIFSVVWSLVAARALVAPLLRSISAQTELLLATALCSLLTVVLVAPAASLGTVALAVVLTLKHVTFIAVGFVLVRQYFNVSTRTQVAAIIRPLLAACAMLLSIEALRALQTDAPAGILVPASVVLGVAVYTVVLSAMDSEYGRYMSAIIRWLR